MSKRFDICIPRPKKDGGTFWHKVGVAFDGDKGMTLYFDSLPLQDAEGRCVAMLFEAKDRQKSSPQEASQAAQAPLDDAIPFMPERRG